MDTAKYWIEKLDLAKHPEGGYFKEVFRSDEFMPKTALPARYRSNRNFATSIYFLLEGTEFSSFHRIQSDETWHFYVGLTLELYVLNADGSLSTYLLGQNPEQGESLQITIPRNHWFGARVVDATGFALLGCTVAPGFHFNDFELGDRAKLLEKFPEHEQIITELSFD